MGNGNIITYEILDNDTNDVVYHSNIEDGYIVLGRQYGCYIQRSKKIMSLIDKLEDLVIKVDTEYQEKMEAVIREIVPGMPEGNVRHAAELMCTDRMGNMMDIDVYILREEDRPYECHYLKDLLEDRVARIDKMHEDKSYTYNIDDNYWCATCGSHSHKKDSETGYCWHCDTVNWVKEDGADVRV